ncbi:MAG: hypothetical protein H6R18_73 [Proteobacteria bacterium]|nr:hypothetical protein [Pseudomonadota bacterium]
MKRVISVAALALLATTTLAADCPPVAEYRVGNISYRARPMQQSLDHLLRATPYKGVVEARAEVVVKARRLAGSLSRSLDALAVQAGTRWRQEGCVLRFSAKAADVVARPLAAAPRVTEVVAEAAKPAAAVWTLRADVPIHLQFAEWARRAGWHFEWKLEKSWIVPATAQFSGTFDEVLSQAVEGLYAQGKPVRLIIWEGNRFAEIVDVDAK